MEAGRFGRITLASAYIKWWRTQEYYDSGAWRGTWKLDGSTLTIVIRNVENVGDATYTGDVTDAAGPIDLTLTFSDVDETRTITITKTS